MDDICMRAERGLVKDDVDCVCGCRVNRLVVYYVVLGIHTLIRKGRRNEKEWN